MSSVERPERGLDRLRAVSERLTLSSAQLAVADESGFAAGGR
jgi:hypothetical protein